MDRGEPVESSPQAQHNPRNAAIVFASLPSDCAEQVTMCLREQHLSALRGELGTLGRVTDPERQAALTEFASALKASHREQGKHEGRSPLDTAGSGRENSAVGEIDVHALNELLQDEHPQLIALALSRLSEEKGAALFASLPPEAAIESGIRMALTENADAAVVEYVDSLLCSNTQSSDRGGRKIAPDARRVLRAGLRYAEKEVKRGILNALVDQDRADLAAEIGEALYVFEDLLSLEDRFIQRLLSEVTPTDLAVALKGVGEQHRDIVWRNLSERAAETLREEMELLGRVRRRDVKAAQEKFMAAAKLLVEDGAIDMYAGEDEYLE